MLRSAILLAAGSGSRLGSTLPKALVPLDGVPLLVHAAQRLLASGEVTTLVVTAPSAHVADVRAALGGLALPDGSAPALTVVPGGVSRQASVAAGLAALPPGDGTVLVHDAARALTPPQVIARVAQAVAAGHVAVTPLVPVVDSLQAVADGAFAGGRLPDGGAPTLGARARTGLGIVQTPQGFDRGALEAAHAAARAAGVDGSDEATAATDDATLVERAGHVVHAVAGHDLAMKITTRRDLALAQVLLADHAAHDEEVPA
ncbi:IspD/TarI family cytidylyltransferase [Sanguibacter sp. A247]|uniref:IspD/TarI family cytidylyltransferase n=1 Tax=unclassified Sanguibacter TaxID=2645534 RepID=UPI003FD75706